LLRYKPYGIVSGRPPFFEIIVAQPLDAASNDVRPNGSSQCEGTTEILDFL